jgi:hypothetical protein
LASAARAAASAVVEPKLLRLISETGTPNSTTRPMASGLFADAGASVKRTRSPAACAS